MASPERYHLGVGEAARERLELLEGLYDPATRAFLAGAGLARGMRALDVGCGAGGMTRWIAERVGPEGRVTAIDQSREQLEAALARATACGLDNVRGRAIALADLDALDERFDLVFCRWVLLHVPDPDAAVRAMCRRLAAGGILVLEDCSTDTVFCQPEVAAFETFKRGWLDVSRALGIDPRIGDRLPALLAQAGCRPRRYAVFQPMLATPRERLLPALSLAESRAVHLSTGALDAAAAERAIQELHALAAGPSFLGFVRNVQVAGTSPAAAAPGGPDGGAA